MMTIMVGKCWALNSLDENFIDAEFNRIKKQMSQPTLHKKNASDLKALDSNALILATDKDPSDVSIRRLEKLIGHLHLQGVPTHKITAFKQELSKLKNQKAKILAKQSTSQVDIQSDAFKSIAALRKQVAISNPLLDFSDLIFVTHGIRSPGNEREGDHMCDQYYGQNSKNGGKLILLKNAFSSNPQVIDIVGNTPVSNGRLAGKSLSGGAFLSPELSYDGKTVYFAWSPGINGVTVKEFWTTKSSFHVFKINLDGTNLVQLTDGTWDEFDPCELPNGKICFVSSRRARLPGKDYGFCFARCGGYCPAFTLHTMQKDGSDIIPISYHETNEWHPSVANDGMLLYTRWDYVDRNFSAAHHMWISNPDGTNPRAPHGNYAFPRWSTDPNIDKRGKRPWAEFNIRAIPRSSKFIATAGPHHGQSFGSLVLIDTRIEDDGLMSQVQRITPEAPFPEAETLARTGYVYGTAWPLSEDYYICNYYNDLILLDKFGNRELIYKCTDPGFRAIDPIPVKVRTRPPIIPTKTAQGIDGIKDGQKATILVSNVYVSDFAWPVNAKVKWLRILQYLPKTNDAADVPRIGYGSQNAARAPLGIVPVESDGSAYFQAPINKSIYFQALDSTGAAIVSMRSVTYVHAGEQMSCIGCHENKWKAAPQLTPMALKRPPSRISEEFQGQQTNPKKGAIPFNFHLLVKPVIEQKCLPCHRTQDKSFTTVSYSSLNTYAHYWHGGGDNSGSRSTPGNFGAYGSKLGKALYTPTHQNALRDEKITAEDFRRVILWLDCASDELGAYQFPEKQIAGIPVWPLLDIDSLNPVGTEWPEDKTAPTIAPQNVTSSSITDKSVNISWTPLPQNADSESGINGFVIYLNGEVIKTIYNQTQTTIFNLKELTNYKIEVAAVNGANILGPKSIPITVTSLADKTPPLFTSAFLIDSLHLKLVFSEPIQVASAENLTNYTISKGITLLSAKMEPEPYNQSVVLTLKTVPIRDELYTITVQGVQDLAKTPNVIVNTQKPFSWLTKPTAQASSFHKGNEPDSALDGKLGTIWHSEWSPTAAPLPIWMTINVGNHTINGLRYVPRQDGPTNGFILDYKIYISSDNKQFTPVSSGTWSNDASEKVVMFTPTKGSYVRLEALKSSGPFVAASEIVVLSSDFPVTSKQNRQVLNVKDFSITSKIVNSNKLTFNYTIPLQAEGKIVQFYFYDLKGKVKSSFKLGPSVAGKHSISFNLYDYPEFRNFRSFYLCKLKTGSWSTTKKVQF